MTIKSKVLEELKKEGFCFNLELLKGFVRRDRFEQESWLKTAPIEARTTRMALEIDKVLLKKLESLDNARGVASK